ncbi:MULTISPECIES: hypothetical protein [Cupriavidus]
MRNRFAPLWIWLMLYPLALDFKSVDENGTRILQILLTVPAVGAAAALALIAPRFTGRTQLSRLAMAALLLTVPGSLVAQLVQGNDLGNYLRVLLPFLLLLLGYLAARHPWPEDRLAYIEGVMFNAVAVSLLFTFAYGMAVGGGLENVRFRIVSPAFLVLQGVLLHEFVIARRVTKMNLLLFIVSVVIEMLSVTRSLLVGTALLFLFATWLSAPSIRHLMRAALRATVITATLAGGTALIGSALFPSVAAHWTQRLAAAKATESGIDPTTATRLAELKDQYDQVTQNKTSLLVGKGYGHYYRYSPAYLPALTGQMTEKEFYAINEWTAGHNFWVYQLFAGGLLFGIALPAIVLYALYRGSVAYRHWRRVAPDAPYLAVLGRALLVLASLPAASIGGNPLGPRFSGLLYGVALGLLVATHARLLRAEARGRQEAPAQQAPAAGPAAPAWPPLPGGAYPHPLPLPAPAVVAAAAADPAAQVPRLRHQPSGAST